MTDLLTEEEHEALRLTGQLANHLRAICIRNKGASAEHDWSEMAYMIHRIQNAIMAQAAARAYPELYRPLGGWPNA